MAVRVHGDREFELLDGVYDPGEDSYLLAGEALKAVRPGDRVLDVGTGSGVVSLFVKDVTPDVVATDISPIACRNALINGVQAVRADLCGGICGRFDLVVFNPPYLPTAPEERLGTWLDRAFDGGADGRREIGRFARGAGRVLAPGGRILTVVSSLTGIDETMALFVENGFRAGVAATEKVPFETLAVLKFFR